MKNKFIYTVLSVMVCAFAHAQNIGIGTTLPDASAMLEIKSSNKGLLVPRVALTGTGDVSTITSPAASLLIYNTATTAGATAVEPGYYYWSGTAWLRLVAGSTALSGGPAWLLTGNAGTIDGVNFIGTTDNVPFNVRVGNQKSGRIDSTLKNTFWGYQSGANTTGTDNTANGFQALFTNTTGIKNTATGSKALTLNTVGTNNTATGFNALSANTAGNYNTAHGSGALQDNTSGDYNTADGYHALFNNTTGNQNTALGAFALKLNTSGGNNVAVGMQALALNTTASNLVAIGDSALYTNTGAENTAVGSRALFANTTGIRNTAIGHLALYTATGLGNNTAVGYKALYASTTGDANTAIGSEALTANTTGLHNTANGFQALKSNTTGDFNCAIGYISLQSNTIGNFNTAVGDRALFTNTSGDFNTAVGYNAGVSNTFYDNTTAIGNGASVSASNKIRFGNSAVTTIEGTVAFSVASDARFKYNIKNNVPGLAFITKLNPVTYYFDDEKLARFAETGITDNQVIPAVYTGEKTLRTGFLAQDVARIAAELGYQFDGVHLPANSKDHYSLAYSQFVMPLVKSVQEQQAMIEALSKLVARKEMAETDVRQQDLVKAHDLKIKNMDRKIQMMSKQLSQLSK